MQQQKVIICKGCGKKVIWNAGGYGWCCVQNWKEKPKEKIFTFRDSAWLLCGICCGLVIAYFLFYMGIINILDHLRIENIAIGFNESKLIDLAYQKVNGG